MLNSLHIKSNIVKSTTPQLPKTVHCREEIKKICIFFIFFPLSSV